MEKLKVNLKRSRVTQQTLSNCQTLTRKMTTIYNQMLTAEMPEHLVENIAKGVHMIFIRESLEKIKQIYSPFERIFCENAGESFLNVLKNEYPEMEIRVLNDFQCGEHITVILKLTATKFILFHEYKEYGTNEWMLMEGEVKNNGYIFDRFFYQDNWRGQKRIHRVEEYMKGEGINHIPFQFLDHVMNMEDHEFTYCYDAVKKNKWVHSKAIYNWFLQNEETIWMEYAVEEDF